ncbi:hypothetical protein PR202_ga19458 [Eleusine coracana subsp. coracana]|uniref:Uncharacterized protein n=1 Tax=Eleusine coracana subsp. coracana TaxID=191504 RepID=A0AAV5CV67_ELECO|nr:hypothetical protein PR202_ga19458 [Eleusine coracana subsp. coracana]
MPQSSSAPEPKEQLCSTAARAAPTHMAPEAAAGPTSPAAAAAAAVSCRTAAAASVVGSHPHCGGGGGAMSYGEMLEGRAMEEGDRRWRA